MSTSNNAARLFDRNPLHVAHLQGPVDRLPDTNLRAIYERAGKILLIQRWKDIKSGEPNAFLLFETEQAAHSCCSRIGALRITSDRQSSRPITASPLSCADMASNSTLQQWLRSQNMAPSYIIKNPPSPPPSAGFPLSCLSPLTENCGVVVQMLQEHQCGPSWWRFVAQMYVSNKLWAPAQFILSQSIKSAEPVATEGEARNVKGKENQGDATDDIIDISDDSAVENMSESDDDQPNDFARKQQLQKSATATSKRKTSAASHNVWLPRKRANVQDARVKLGVVTAKQAPRSNVEKVTTPAPEAQPTCPEEPVTSAPPAPQPEGVPAAKVGEPSSPSAPAPPVISPPFVPTPMIPDVPATQPASAAPGSPEPPTVPATLPPAPKSAPRASTVSLSPKATADQAVRSKAAVRPSLPPGPPLPLPPLPAASLPTPPTSQPEAIAPPARPVTETPARPHTIKESPSPGTKPPILTPPKPSIGSTTEQPSSISQGAPSSTSPPKPLAVLLPKPASDSKLPGSAGHTAASVSPKPYPRPPLGGPPISTLVRFKEGLPKIPPTAEAFQVQQRIQKGTLAETTEPQRTVLPALPAGMPQRPSWIPTRQETAPVPLEEPRQKPSTDPASGDNNDQLQPKEERGSPLLTTAQPGKLPTRDDVATRSTDANSRPNEPLSYFGISSSPGDLGLAPSSSISPGTSSPQHSMKRKSEIDPRGFEARLKRMRRRGSSKSEATIVIEPEVSALEAEKARAAELQAEEDRVRELLEAPSPSVDMSDYAETVITRLSDPKSQLVRSCPPLSDIQRRRQGRPQEVGFGELAGSTSDMDPRAWKATIDENEALKMKIKVLELTLPTAETVKSELYAERKQKTRLIEELEIERSLLKQSEALRRQSEVTREELTTRIKQLEDRLAESAVTLEKAREAAQLAAEQRRKAEEANHVADAERVKISQLLDAERALVNTERASLAREREAKAEAEARLAAAEAKLSTEQRRYAEASEMVEKERIKAKDFLEAEKAIVSAQEAKLAREREIRAEIEAKLGAVEERLKVAQSRHVEQQKTVESTLHKELSRAKNLINSERAQLQNERVRLAQEQDVRSHFEKQIAILKEQLRLTTEKLTVVQEGIAPTQRQLSMARDQMNEGELRERVLKSQIATWHSQFNAAKEQTLAAENRARAAEDRAKEAEDAQKRQILELTKVQKALDSEKDVLLMERATLARERIARIDLEKKNAAAEERILSVTKQANELRQQFKDSQTASDGTREQLQTQRTLLHIARTRIQELEQAIQRVETDLSVARSAEATAKTMIQLWGPRFEPPPRPHLRRTDLSPISDIVPNDMSDDQVTEHGNATTEAADSFIPLMKPPRQPSFKLKRTSLPVRLLKVDMPSGEGVNIDLGGLPANPAAIIDLLYKSKCAGVFWDIIMDEYGAMGCFEAAEAVAEGKLKCQL